MELIKKEIEVEKEMSEFFDALQIINQGVKDKKAIGIIAAEAFPYLIKGIEGIQKVAETYQDKKVFVRTMVHGAETLAETWIG